MTPVNHPLTSLARFFAGTGGALSTPSGVNAALLPTYCPADHQARPDYAGGVCRSRRRP
jgi:hypothetical protein